MGSRHGVGHHAWAWAWTCTCEPNVLAMRAEETVGDHTARTAHLHPVDMISDASLTAFAACPLVLEILLAICFTC